MTYDNVLNTRALQGLVAILKKMKELNNGGPLLPNMSSRSLDISNNKALSNSLRFGTLHIFHRTGVTASLGCWA